MIQQSTINACVKAYYGSNEDTDYGKIQAVLLAYESIMATPAPPVQSPSYDALLIILQAMCGGLERAGITDCDNPGEAIDLIRERAERAEAALEAQPAPVVGGDAGEGAISFDDWFACANPHVNFAASDDDKEARARRSFAREAWCAALNIHAKAALSTRPAESVAQGGEAVRYESRPVDKGTPPLNPKWTPCLREDYEDFIAGKTNGFREYRATPTPATGSGGELISARPGGEAVAWVVFDSKQDRYVIFNPELASAIAERGLLTLPVFGQYEWLDAKINEWKPINRLPYTWERELGIQWRAHPAQAGGDGIAPGCGDGVGS